VRDGLTSQALDDEIPPGFVGGDRHRAPRRESKAVREERACAEVSQAYGVHSDADLKDDIPF
jgi:hypothetical protein